MRVELHPQGVQPGLREAALQALHALPELRERLARQAGEQLDPGELVLGGGTARRDCVLLECLGPAVGEVEPNGP